MRWTSIVLSVLASLAFSLSAIAQDLTGHWEGTIEWSKERSLLFKADLKKQDDSWVGTINFPASNPWPTDLTKITVKNKSVAFIVAGSQGNPSFAGKIKGHQITGTFRVQGKAKPFKLTRTADKPFPPLMRPQTPKPPFPYKSHEVSYSHGDVRLSATLTIPPGKGPHPAVVLITGSGQQNRDEEIGRTGHKPFRVLADHLTRAGIAVLRADDRGVGGSTGDFSTSTSSDFTDDALAGVAFLKARSDIAGTSIGLIGHSEGGLIAPLAASRSGDVAFIVMLAGPGLPGDQVSKGQTRAMMRLLGATSEVARRKIALVNDLIEAAKTSRSDAAYERRREQIAARHFKKMPANEREIIKNAEALLDSIKNTTPPSTWWRYYLNYDPRPTLGKLTVPVLALNGELDPMVLHGQNLPAIKQALEAAPTKDVSIHLLAGLNHHFQKAKTGAISEYGQIEETINPRVLKLITQWITKRFLKA